MSSEPVPRAPVSDPVAERARRLRGRNRAVLAALLLLALLLYGLAMVKVGSFS